MSELRELPPYSKEDYKKAKKQGLNLDKWDDYVEFYSLGELANDYETWRKWLEI